MARDFTALGSQLARAPAQPVDHRPDDEQQHRREQQRQEGEPHREPEQNHDVDDDDDDVLEQRRQGGADGRLRLVGVADDTRDDLAAARALEVAEGQRLDMLEEPYAEVANHVLLNRHAADRRQIRRQVFEQQRDQQDDDDVAQRDFRRPRLQQWSRDPVEHRLDVGTALRRQRGVAEQRPQKRNQEDEREAVEDRGDDRRRDGQFVGAQQP